MPSLSRGFTLVEILIVMVLIGLLSGVAISYLGSGNLDRQLINEGNRLHAVLNMAADEAIFSNVEIGLSIDNEGYEFLTYDEQQASWQPADQAFLRSHVFPEWLSVDFTRDGKKRDILGSTDESGLEDNSKKPMMMFLSSAEVDPFTIGLEVSGLADFRVEIVGDGTDEILINTGGDS